MVNTGPQFGLSNDCPFTEDGVDRNELESRFIPRRGKEFGALPHFDALAQHLTQLESDFERLGALGYGPDKLFEEDGPALLLYRLKFGTSLLDLVDEMVKHHPDGPDRNGGNIIIFGLPNAGKGMLTEAINIDESSVLSINSDRARFHLFARMLFDAEQQRLETPGATPIYWIRELIHGPRFNDMLYLTIKAACAGMRRKGYHTVTTTTFPQNPSDLFKRYYLAHPTFDLADLTPNKRTVDRKLLNDAARKLCQRMEVLCVAEHEQFDWESGNQTTAILRMNPVPQRVPLGVLRGIMRSMVMRVESGKPLPPENRLENPLESNPHVAAQHLIHQLEHDGLFDE